MLEYRRYDRDTYTFPIWDGDTVYNETLMFVGENEAPLLYYPDKVLSVLSYDLKTEYIEGEDYTVCDGRIVLTDNTRIPSFSLDEYYPKDAVAGKCFASTVEGRPYIFFSEGSVIFQRQIHVTYTHSDKWTGFIPQKTEKFKRFFEKAANGEPVKVLFYGDSISTGANSSGRVNCEPYAETWFDMVIGSMKKYFNNEMIECVNTSVGGKNTEWALENLKERAIDIDPDIMFLAFGMNDAGRTPEVETSLIKKIIDEFSASCPNCDVALVAPMLPHFRLRGFWGNQKDFEASFSALCDTYSFVGLVPVTSVPSAVREKKRYYDMTGNNVNHPNDFLARIYAQTVNKVLFG